MPDIDFQKIVLNLIPKREDDPVVFYASQYETTRLFIADLMWGDTEFAPGDDCWAEIDIRKNDDNLVVITEDVAIDNNEVSVILPVQAVTCIGKNLGQVKIYAGADQFVAAFNFILEVQADPLAGGVTSETAIDNLESQIEDIAAEVIGENYYNKIETDALLADKADKSELPDMTDYYTKTETDNLLDDKADISDLATLASKAELTHAILDEDTALKNWAYTQFATPGYVASNYYTKLQIDDMLDNIFPTLTASGAIATFTTALTKPLVSVTADPLSTTITRCGKNLFDINHHNESASAVFTLNDDGSLTIENTAEWAISIYWIYTGLLPAGEYTIKNLSADSFYFQFSESDYSHNISANGSYTFNYDGSSYIRLLPSNINAGVTKTFKIQIESGSAFTTYENYISQTVPVADATTLITLSGVNNVFADNGNVTVQYKYMSM